jgi:2-polyprenyl-3-methyl-5-hydroxy-6-metoxy-1,4-benzoquinol methylase
MPCNCCQITDQAFGEDSARSDLRAYQRKGPARQTRELLGLIRSLGLQQATLLDVGGGVGAIYHELLKTGALRATHVDASSAYLQAARQESARLGQSQSVEYVHADFTDVAPDISPADIVTLDRVVCCYPDFRRLLGSAAGRAKHALALSYPRETWYVRLSLWVIDGFNLLRRDPFRVFLHPVAEMDALLRSEGLRRLSLKRLFIWEIALYSRD